MSIQSDYNNPKNYFLVKAYPNPFNPITNIQFSIPRIEFVSLKIYNVLGQEVDILVSEKLPSGDYKYSWNASGLTSGIYYYKIEAGSFVKTHKLILVK